MANAALYLNINSVWIYKDGITDSEHSIPSGLIRRSISSDDEITCFGVNSNFKLFTKQPVTEIEKSGTPSDYYSTIVEFETACKDVFISAGSGGASSSVKIEDENGDPTNLQNPIPTNGHRIHANQIDTTYSDLGTFSGAITDFFDSLKTVSISPAGSNPRVLKFWFLETIAGHSVGLGCDNAAKSYGTDITVKLLGSAEEVRATYNFTGRDGNSDLLEFGDSKFNGIILEFNTAGEVALSNVYIQTSIEGNVTLHGHTSDGVVRDVLVTRDGDLSISDNSSGLSIAQGNVIGMSMMSGMGEWESGTVEASGEDCCRWADVLGPSLLPTPSILGEQMTVVSSSGNDTNGGTGANETHIHYLDVNGDEQIETVIMAGTTPVDTIATNIIFVNDMHVELLGSNGVSVGNITIYKKGGSIGNDLYNLIAAGGNQSMVPHKMIPAGRTLYLMEWHASEAQDKRAAIRIRSTDKDGLLKTGIFLFKDTTYIRKTATGALPLHGIPCPAFSVVKVSHWDDQAGSEGSVGWWGYLKNHNA